MWPTIARFVWASGCLFAICNCCRNVSRADVITSASGSWSGVRCGCSVGLLSRRGFICNCVSLRKVAPLGGNHCGRLAIVRVVASLAFADFLSTAFPREPWSIVHGPLYVSYSFGS